ncbi:nuclear transport factor 2 family protein [Sphingomonas colocasiae]|uniref:Nuclear transport factor 2 family protein n=1 Tax=Sphingomonas colocasiae TaxID=1848973 RepID=A0ABS7PSZ6_9SPHN|nr:nuclear transport factor 2 family protein [Sphingomonas colocasiae]MBY8824296.1 nuclear transport factor 2 family protein [Sphingomonas colocasiae]
MNRDPVLDEAIAAYASRDTVSNAQRSALETLAKWHNAIGAKDLEVLRGMMDAGIVIELPFNESGKTDRESYRVYSGIEQCCAFWTSAFAAEGVIHGISEVDLTVDGAGARIFFECRGHLTMANGRDYRNRYVMRMDLCDGRVLRCKEYYNPIQSAYAFGRPIAGQFMLDRL